jgi:predicted dehydrogenase
LLAQGDMNLAIVGCGYVAESYCITLGNYACLDLVGAYDRNSENLQRLCKRWPVRGYDSLDQLLADSSISVVLNLTNPSSHYDITKCCLSAGKHVYSEKPLAMDAGRARELVEVAHQNGVYLATAPCSVLGEAAQTVWSALRENVIGRVRLVYANFDDDMIAPKQSPWLWQNNTGTYWPAKDEFEVGCTYEHAGYLLTWLAAFFGPAVRVTSFASCLIPDKGVPVDSMAPDFSVGCIEYHGGVVARVTCSLVAPKDKSLTIIGDNGVLSVANVRNDACPVYIRQIPAGRWRAGIERRINSLRRAMRVPGSDMEWHSWSKYPSVRKPPAGFVSTGKPVDFNRGPAEMVNAIQEKRACRLSPELGWHITELIERLQYPNRFVDRPDLTSTIGPMQPLPIQH